MGVTVSPRSRRAPRVAPRSAWVVPLWFGTLLLGVAAVLITCGAISPADLPDGASYWRWQLPLIA